MTGGQTCGGRLRFGSLFSGIGGFDLGFERAGMECAWQVEIDPYCLRVLAKHWPNVPRYGDIKQIDWAQVEPVDVLCGGFPCQPHSLAGKRGASDDERDLWPEFKRAICELRPRWVVAENVRGLLSSESGRFFGGVLRDLASLGYDAEWQVLSAAQFGAPHLRERVWIVAYPHGCGCGRQSNVEGEKTPGRRRLVEGATSDLAGKRTRGLSVRSRGSRQTKADPDGRDSIGDLDLTGLEKRESIRQDVSQKQPSIVGTNWWATEPDVVRLVHGVPDRVDRIRGLGNVAVPQILEWIGRRIVEAA